MKYQKILIDDVDIKPCKFCEINKEYIPWSKCTAKDEGNYTLCCEKPNCKFKQLAREKHKNAELETYKEMLNNPEVIVALIDVKTGERELWVKKTEQYKQALTEIREILHDYLMTPVTQNNKGLDIIRIYEKAKEVLND